MQGLCKPALEKERVMNRSDLFPSKYLSANDVGPREIVAMVDSVELEEMSYGKTKAVVYFVGGRPKPLVLNATNYDTIAEITGQADTINWHGAKIRLFTTSVDYKGKRTLGIRVKAPSAGNGGTRLAAVKDPPPAEPRDGPASWEDEIPY
jgi:hypothetical protein